MNDSEIKRARNGKILTKNIWNMENDNEVSVTYDQGMGREYRNQLGTNRAWVACGNVVFAKERDMMDYARYFSGDGSLSKSRPATPAQVRYMIALRITIPDGCTVEIASQLIDAAKHHELGSIMGATYTDGSN